MFFSHRAVSLSIILSFAIIHSIAVAADVPITDHGATADDGTYDTVAIQAAIDACHAAGGGRVVVPPGTFNLVTVQMKSNIELHLQQGAMLLASANWQDYSDPWSWNSAVINGQGLSNVAITGPGAIDGNDSRSPHGEGGERGAHMIRLHDTKNLTIRDLRLYNCGNYTLFLNGSEDVVVDNVRIEDGWDGLHFRYGKNAKITRLAVIDNRDDGIAGHSNRDFSFEDIYIDGWRANGWRWGCINFTAKRVTVRNKESMAIRHFSPKDSVDTSQGGLESDNWFLQDWVVDNCQGFFWYSFGELWQEGLPLGTVRIDRVRATNLDTLVANLNGTDSGGRDCRFILTDGYFETKGKEAADFTWPPYGFHCSEIDALHLYNTEVRFTGAEDRSMLRGQLSNEVVVDDLRYTPNEHAHPIDIRDDVIHSSLGLAHRWAFDGDGSDAQGDADAIVDYGIVYADTRMEGHHSLGATGENGAMIDHKDVMESFSRASVTFWFLPTDTEGNKILYDEGGQWRGWGVGLNGTTLVARATNEGEAVSVTVPGVLPNEWNFVAVTFDHGRLSVYLNGEEMGKGAINAAVTQIMYHGEPAAIGRAELTDALNLSNAGGLNGQIDDLRLYPDAAIDRLRITSIRGPRPGTAHYLSTGLDNNYVLTCAGGDTQPGTAVILKQRAEETPEQWWRTDPAQGNSYALTPLNTDAMVLDVHGSDPGDGTRIQIWNALGNDNQRWYFVRQGQDFQVVPAFQQTSSMTVAEGAAADNSRIHLWSVRNDDSQRWSLLFDTSLNPYSQVDVNPPEPPDGVTPDDTSDDGTEQNDSNSHDIPGCGGQS